MLSVNPTNVLGDPFYTLIRESIRARPDRDACAACDKIIKIHGGSGVERAGSGFSSTGSGGAVYVLGLPGARHARSKIVFILKIRFEVFRFDNVEGDRSPKVGV